MQGTTFILERLILNITGKRPRKIFLQCRNKTSQLRSNNNKFASVAFIIFNYLMKTSIILKLIEKLRISKFYGKIYQRNVFTLLKKQ